MAPELFSPARSISAPSRISHYEIVRKLGDGGMGVVYLARDVDLDRLVALKFLPADIVRNQEKIARFRVEARAISALNHPHVATIFGIEDTGEYHFLALEYLSGGSLADKLDEMRSVGETLPVAQSVAWGLQIAEGLAHAHRHGIVHRDIKASNVLFTDEGRIKIVDFGLAKILADRGDRSPNTESGSVLGTPVYMAPEQAQGLPADERSDVFSLGVLLFEMVAGKVPFRGANTPAILHEIVYSPAPSLRELRPDADFRLDAIVAKALEKDPANRYQNAGELARDMHGLASSSDARAPSITRTIAPLPRRKKRWRPIAAAAAMAAVLGAGVVAYWPRLRAPLNSAETAPQVKSIAVLLFTNVGGDPANLPLADGLMELVSNSLTRLEQFHGSLLVAPASDVRKENVTSARDAGRVLGVNLAITGSVERIGPGDVQVFLNLVDTRAVKQLRTESIRAPLTDLAALQDGVVEKVAHMLELAFQPERSQAMRTANTAVPAAYPHYVEGLGYLRRYDRPQNVDNAIAAFERALAIDPSYALAYAGAAEAYWRRYDMLKEPTAVDAALARASKALSLNDQLATVHITMGMIRAGKGEYELAAREMRTALQLDPLSADAYRELGAAYESMGRDGDAEATYRKAIELRKDDWWSVKQLGVFYFRKSRYAEAERSFRDVIRLTPDSAKAHSNLGGVLLAMGRTADAAAQFARSLEIEPNANGYSNLGTLYYFDGRYADAVGPFEKAAALAPGDSKFWLNLADSYRWAPGMAEKAPAAFRHAIELIEKEIAVNPRDGQLRSKLAMARSALGEHRAAMDEIERALAITPADGSAHFRAALVYEQARQRERALHEVEAALRANYRLREILRAPPLASLRQDPRFQPLVTKFAK